MSKSVLMISTDLFHYRVSVLNHLNIRLHEIDYDLSVLTSLYQKSNPNPILFRLLERPFRFLPYKTTVKEIKPDIVIINLRLKDYIVWPLLAWLKFRKTKIIFWGHGINLLTPDNKTKRLLYTILHRLSDALVLYTPNEVKYIAEKYRDKIYIANNTLNFNDFPAIEKSKDTIKAEYDIRFDKVVLFAGRITKEKRLDDLLDAANYLDDDICVVIVGGGLDAGQEEKIRDSQNIFYIGEIYDAVKVNEVFKMADAFSIPGKMGLGLNQAMYWGLPVVTEDVRHAPEIAYLIHGENGFIVPKHDVRGLAEKINYLLSDIDIYQNFSNTARSSIIKNANIDVMCDGFINAIHAVNT